VVKAKRWYLVGGLECESEGWVDVLRLLLANAEFQRIEEVNPRDETTQGGDKFARFRCGPLDPNVSARSKLRKCSTYRAIRRGSNDRVEAEPYHHPEERGLVTEESERIAITSLVPEKLIVQVLSVRPAREFAPDADQGERNFSRHVPKRMDKLAKKKSSAR